MKGELVNTTTGEIIPGNEAEDIKTPVVRLGGDEMIDVQIATAKRYPRSIKHFQAEALSMATIDKDTAESCFYVLKRKDKSGEEVKIEGPGIRLAEIVGNCWRNFRYGAKVIGETEDRHFVIAEGYAYDLEKNVASAISVQRRITNRIGKRYSDDMIGVTANAACSIALRNAIFKVIPMTYITQIFEAAKKLAAGDSASLSTNRSALVRKFKALGVTEEQLLAKVGKPSLEDVGIAELQELIGIGTAIKEGTSTIDDEFTKQPTAGKEEKKTLAEKVKAAKDAREPGSEG